MAGPGEYGLTNVRQACVSPDLAPFFRQAPDEYLFCDAIHPTREAYAIAAEAAGADDRKGGARLAALGTMDCAAVLSGFSRPQCKGECQLDLRWS